MKKADLINYADAVYRDDKDTRKLTSEYLFKLIGGLIAWKSGRQPMITLSLTEAEYVALIITVKEAAALRLLLGELGYSDVNKDAICLYEDNISTIDLIKRPTINGRSKHIKIHWH